MSEPLEHEYFNWLCAKVVDHFNDVNGVETLSYSTLLMALYTTEFVWMIVGDDNRAEDGKDLRAEFLLELDIPDNPQWRIETGCSILEMLIAFSRRAEYQTDIPAREWFWEFINNLGFLEMSDSSLLTAQDIQEFLEPFIWRTYEMDGSGGLFPMKHPHRDQREVEIWYQFCDYLVDQNRLP